MRDQPRSAKASLRAQLLWWMVPPLIVVGVISAFVSYTIAGKVSATAYDEELFDTAKSLAAEIRDDPEGHVALDLPPAAQRIILSDPYDQIFFRVFTPSNDLIAGHVDLQPPPEPLTPEEPVQFYATTVSGKAVRAAAYTLFENGNKPRATILVAETLNTRKMLVEKILFAVAVPVATLTLVFAGIVWFGVRRGLNPLRRVTAAVSQRGWGDLRLVGDHGAPEEVQPLTRAIDDLMRRLDENLRSQRRFISEAAHQLLTPLSGLFAQTERALLSRDIETIKPALEQLGISAQRVTRLVNQLLALARAEPGSDFTPAFVPLDLAALVQQTCMEWVPEALEKGADLGYSGETGPVMISGDQSMLTDMLNNLVDNAIRYGARRGGTITITLSASPRIELSVEDDGPGIPEQERAKIFERFHRVPGSAPGGCGLGLSIVREIARAHGAQVAAYPGSTGNGTLIRVVFGEGSS